MLSACSSIIPRFIKSRLPSFLVRIPPTTSPQRVATSQALDIYEPPRRPFLAAASGVASNYTTRFTTLGCAPLSPEMAERLRGKTVVFVRGYLARLYVAAGGTYLDKHADYCRQLGMHVIMGDVHGGANAKRNSESLYRQILLETTPQDSVIIIAHSYGTLATLELLQSPKYADIHGRVDAFIPINGVFQGTPLAELNRFPIVGGLLDRVWGVALRVFGGDSDTLYDMRPANRVAYIERNYDNIRQMLERTTVVPLATSYDIPAGPTDVLGFGMLMGQLYMRVCGGPNDGAVPEASQILPGSHAVVLRGMHHADAVDDFGRYSLPQMMRGLLCLALESMPESRRLRGRPGNASTKSPALALTDGVLSPSNCLPTQRFLEAPSE